MADDEYDNDGDEHHGDLVVPPLVRADGVVEPRRPVDGSEDAGVEEDQRQEGDDDQRDRVRDHNVVAAVSGVPPEGFNRFFRVSNV